MRILNDNSRCMRRMFYARWRKPVIGKLRRQGINTQSVSLDKARVKRPALMLLCTCVKGHVSSSVREGFYAQERQFCLRTRALFSVRGCECLTQTICERSQEYSAVVIFLNCRGFFICPANGGDGTKLYQPAANLSLPAVPRV